MNCGEFARGECIPTNTSDPCGAGKRTLSRPCVDGTIEKCTIDCRNATEDCNAGENKPDCEITTATTTPPGMFDSFYQMFLLIACSNSQLNTSGSISYLNVITLLDQKYCQPNPCQHDGICEDLVSNYSCTCTPEYIGRNCEGNENAKVKK